MKLAYIKELDGVRGIAALMVMFFHFFQTNAIGASPVNQIFKKVTIFGQTGVTLFFVLSGFLITRILISTKFSSNYFKVFYIRRSIRIFPLYFGFLFLFFFVLPLTPLWTKHPFAEEWYFWVYLQNFAKTFNWNSYGPSHFWSLAVEEHFYLFWPILLYYLPIRKLPILILSIILIAFIVRIILITNGFGTFYFTLATMDALALGGLLAYQEASAGLESFVTKKILKSFLIFAIVVIIIWTYNALNPIKYLEVLKSLLTSLIYYYVLALILSFKGNGMIVKILNNNILQYSGAISYGLYVFHPVIFKIIKEYQPSNAIIVNLIIAFGFSFLIASLSFRFFERKFLFFKKYFNYQ